MLSWTAWNSCWLLCLSQALARMHMTMASRYGFSQAKGSQATWLVEHLFESSQLIPVCCE